MREDSVWSGGTRIGKAEVEIGVEMDEKIEKGFGSGVINVRYERLILIEVLKGHGERAIVLG